MRSFTLSTAILLPAALIAQAPDQGGQNLAARFNAELPGIQQLVEKFMPQDALVKAEALIPTPKPDYKTADLNAIVGSMNNYRGLVSIYRLCGNTAASAGDFEKGKGYYEKALEVSKENSAKYKAAALPILQGNLDQLQKNFELHKAAWDKYRSEEMNATVTVPDPKDAKKQIQQPKWTDEQKTKTNAEYEKKANLFQDYIQKVQKNIDLANGDLKALDEEATKVQAKADELGTAIKTQSEEIAKFNTDHGKKKGKKVEPLVGNSAWVDAIMLGIKKDPTNLTNHGGAQAQAEFLNRLLVLDPGNKLAQKALDNIKQGKDAFAVEKKAPKGKKTK